VAGLGLLYPFKIKNIISRTKFESAQKRDASEFIPMVERLGLISFKNNKIISRTKFESAQKRDAPEFYWGVYYMLQS
jgi:hypothetical protein